MEKTQIKTLSTSRYFDRLRNLPFVSIKTFGPENQRKEKLAQIPSFVIPLVDSGTGEQAQFLLRFDEILDGFDKLDAKITRRLLSTWVGSLLESANSVVDGPKYELRTSSRVDIFSFLTYNQDREPEERALDDVALLMHARLNDLYKAEPELTVTMKPAPVNYLQPVKGRYDNLKVEALLGYGVKLNVWRDPEQVDLTIVANNIVREGRLGGTVTLGGVVHRFSVTHDLFDEDVIGNYATHGAIEEAFAALWKDYTLLNGRIDGVIPKLSFFK